MTRDENDELTNAFNEYSCLASSIPRYSPLLGGLRQMTRRTLCITKTQTKKVQLKFTDERRRHIELTNNEIFFCLIKAPERQTPILIQVVEGQGSYI